MKKYLSILLSCAVILNISAPALAFDAGGKSVASEEIPDCDKYKITFDLPVEELKNGYSARELEEYETTVVKNHNEQVAEQAKDFVLSLGLADANLDFIEDSCLQELDEIANVTDYLLTSYTVRVPKGALSSEASLNSTAPLDSLTYYGTYANRDFYYYYFSESTGSTEYKKTTSQCKLWAQNLLDLVLCFADAGITVPYTYVKQAMGNPIGYTPNDKAYSSFYFNVNITSRGIYTEYRTLPSMTVTYQQVTSGQIGHLYPFVIYHPVQSPTYLGSYNIELGYQGAVYTPNFKDKDKQLKEAYNAFIGGVEYHYKVMDYKRSYYWEKK